MCFVSSILVSWTWNAVSLATLSHHLLKSRSSLKTQIEWAFLSHLARRILSPWTLVVLVQCHAPTTNHPVRESSVRMFDPSLETAPLGTGISHTSLFAQYPSVLCTRCCPSEPAGQHETHTRETRDGEHGAGVWMIWEVDAHWPPRLALCHH